MTDSTSPSPIQYDVFQVSSLSYQSESETKMFKGQMAPKYYEVSYAFLIASPTQYGIGSAFFKLDTAADAKIISSHSH